MNGEPNQSSRSPLSSTTCSKPRPSPKNPSPTKSILNPLLKPFLPARESTMSSEIITTEITPTGTFRKKIHRQV